MSARAGQGSAPGLPPEVTDDRAGAGGLTTPEPKELADEDLAVFLEMSNEIFGVFDLEQGLVWSNGAAATLLGYDEEELARLSLVDLIHADDLVEALALFDQPTGHPEPAGIQSRYRCKDGSWRWLEWTARLEPESGLVYGAARDVTDHHVAQSRPRRQRSMAGGDPRPLHGGHLREGPDGAVPGGQRGVPARLRARP